MRILLGGLAALTLSAASTMAADLPARMPVKAPIMAAEVYNWNGFYIGVNGGYSWGRSRTDANFFNSVTGAAIVPPAGSVTSNSFNLDGGVAGGQAGYNWQTSNWVVGLETDLQWSGERGSATFSCAGVAVIAGPCLPGLTFLPAGIAGTSLTVDQKIEWFGTFRARAGLLVTPSVLAYVTGGLAYGSVKTDMTLGGFSTAGAPLFASSSASKVQAGWTAGGGLEAKFARNWSGKLEYLYMDLGTFNGTVALAPPPATTPAIGANISSRVTDHIFRAGINYHFDAGPVVARY